MVRSYTRAWCGYCTAALRLLRERNVHFEEIDTTVVFTSQRRSSGLFVPQIFAGDRPLGGYTDLVALDERGVLDALLDIEPHGSSVSG